VRAAPRLSQLSSRSLRLAADLRAGISGRAGPLLRRLHEAHDGEL